MGEEPPTSPTIEQRLVGSEAPEDNESALLVKGEVRSERKRGDVRSEIA